MKRKISKTSGKEIKSGAGTRTTGDLQAIVLLNMTSNAGNATGDGIWMDRQGQCFLGSYSQPEPMREDNPQPIAPKLVTASEALRWFADNDEHSIDGSGSIAPIIRAALKE